MELKEEAFIEMHEKRVDSLKCQYCKGSFSDLLDVTYGCCAFNIG